MRTLKGVGSTPAATAQRRRQRRQPLPDIAACARELGVRGRAREVAGFMVWAAAIAVHFANIMGVWIVFFRQVIGNDGALLKEKMVIVWAVWFWLACCWRQMIRRKGGMLIRRVLEHVEMFIFTSMACGMSTNITFFLHTPNPTLYDVGFQFVPEQALDSGWRPLSDIMTVNLPFVMVVGSFTWSRAERCQLFVDWTRMMSIMYGLRVFCIPVTSLPGPAPHCLAGNKDYLAPQDWIDMLTWMGPLVGKFGTCGDLLFSGHSAYCCTTLLLIVRRCNVRYPTTARGRGLRWCCAALYFLSMCSMAIAGRKHYTVDMVLGTIISSLSFFNFEHSWNRDQLSLLELAARVQGGGGQRASDGSGSLVDAAAAASAAAAIEMTAAASGRAAGSSPAAGLLSETLGDYSLNFQASSVGEAEGGGVSRSLDQAV